MVTSVKQKTSKIISYINKGNERSVKIKKNLVLSVLFKGLNILVSLTLVPLTIDYVSPKQYGVWLTLSSIIAWISFFDIGLGNGLRNKFAEAVAHNKVKLARIYVSTTYAVLTVITAFALLVFLVLNPFLNWSEILNTPENSAEQLGKLALVVFTFFCIHFVLLLVTTVATANQQPAKASAINLIGNSLALLVIYILTKFTYGNLVTMGVVLSGANVLVLALSSIYLYNGEYKKYSPSIKLIRLRYTKLLTKIGFKFFLVQIAAIILFQCNNIIIAQLFGPSEVTPYNIVYRYFGIITMVASIFMTPLWSAFTDAWHKKDYEWIKSTVNKLQKFWLGLLFASLIMLLLSPIAYKIWIGERATIPFILSLFMALNTLIITWNMIYIQFLNGIGKIQLQLYSGVFGTCLTIPLTILLANYFDIAGVICASCCLGIVNTVWTHMQYKKIINRTATGIWNK